MSGDIKIIYTISSLDSTIIGYHAESGVIIKCNKFKSELKNKEYIYNEIVNSTKFKEWNNK